MLTALVRLSLISILCAPILTLEQGGGDHGKQNPHPAARPESKPASRPASKPAGPEKPKQKPH